MTIDVHFDSLDEFQRYMVCCAAAEPIRVWPEEGETAPAEADSAPATAPTPQAEEPTPAPQEEEPAPAPKIDESLAVEARKLLAALNKRTGRNAAKELLNGMGYKSFKDVPLEAVPDVIAKVKEADDAE